MCVVLSAIVQILQVNAAYATGFLVIKAIVV